MRFGIYSEMQAAPGRDHAALVWETMAQVEYADRAGFDIVSLVDHHFFEQFSISANPLAFFAAAAQRTRRIRFRTALHPLPLENPMQLAGRIAEADILTEGRIECGVGRGHPWLFGPSNVKMEESKTRYEEGLDILLAAWAEERFSYEGKVYQIKDASVVPRPIQRPHPPMFMGGSSEATYRRAGERGYGILLPPLLPAAVLAEPLGIYTRACLEHGHTPNIVYIRPVILAEEEGDAWREAERALPAFLAFNLSPLASLESVKERLVPSGYGFYGSEALPMLCKLSARDLVAQGVAFVGTPEQVLGQLRELTAASSMAELSIVASFGGLEQWKVLRTMELFATRILPSLRPPKSADMAR